MAPAQWEARTQLVTAGGGLQAEVLEIDFFHMIIYVALEDISITMRTKVNFFFRLTKINLEPLPFLSVNHVSRTPILGTVFLLQL